MSPWPLARDGAAEVARLAGALLRERAARLRTISWKDAGWTNPVTDADQASEALILAELARRFPADAVLAEESGGAGAGGRRWLVDPLDGTVNYAHGVPHFCVSLALEEQGRVVAGVVYEPLRDELFAAALGEGATLNGAPLSVAAAPSLARALLCTGFPYDLPTHPAAPLGLFTLVVPRAQGLRRTGAAALDLAWVAAGRYDGFWEFGLQPWDLAAGALLITEAGGLVQGLDGSPFTPHFPHVVAGAPAVVAELGPLCAGYWASRPGLER